MSQLSDTVAAINDYSIVPDGCKNQENFLGDVKNAMTVTLSLVRATGNLNHYLNQRWAN